VASGSFDKPIIFQPEKQKRPVPHQQRDKRHEQLKVWGLIK